MSKYLIGAAIGLLTASVADAMPLACTSDSHTEVTSKLKGDYGETVRLVGMFGGATTNVPMELYVSDKGTWTMVILTPQGICFLAAGTHWQAVEPEPVGVEN
jgi:hypothetical protein